MTVSRRHLLKNLSLGAGAATLSPALAPLLRAAQAEAAGEIPQRFVFVVKSSGITPEAIQPPGLADALRTEQLADLDLTTEKLPSSLAGLETVKDKLTIVQGLSGKMCKGGHSSWYGALGCYRTGGEHNTGRVRWATIDGALANALPNIFPHVGLTLGGRVMDAGSELKNSVIYPGISAIARDRPLPFQGSPLRAYHDLFGVAAAGREARAKQTLHANLLDFMVDDIKRLEKQVAVSEKDKLQHYLEAYESLRERKRKLHGVEARIRANAPEVSDKFTSEVETDRLEAHFDLATAALMTGLTNVITIRADTLSIRYDGLGLTEKNVHGIGHGESTNGKTSAEARAVIRKFHLDQVGRMASRLQKVPEGDGTMLDHTLIVYLSDAAEKHHASCSQWPFILVGGLGNSWRKGGRYLQYPSYAKPGHHTIANLYLTLLHAVGKPRDTFGQLDLNLDQGMQQGPLGELLV